MSTPKRPWPFQGEQSGQEKHWQASKRIETRYAQSDWGQNFSHESTSSLTLGSYDRIPVPNDGSTYLQSWHDPPEEEICFGSVQTSPQKLPRTTYVLTISSRLWTQKHRSDHNPLPVITAIAFTPSKSRCTTEFPHLNRSPEIGLPF